MTSDQFKEYASENGCTIDGHFVKNVINGRCTRIDASFNETSDLQAVHHVCVLGIAPPDDLEDLYAVYSGLYMREVGDPE